VNNVEHFDGTVKDTANWSEYEYTPQDFVSQSDQILVSSANGDRAEYRGRYAVVGVGGFVQVTANMKGLSSEPGAIPELFLALTTPPFANQRFEYTDRPVSVDVNGSQPVAWEYHGDGGSGSTRTVAPLEPEITFFLNQPYILRLDYLTATSLQYRFFDANMNQLCSRTRTLTGLPNMLYIALATQYADGVFDDVTIGGNAFAPEPHSFGLLALFGSMSTRLRRRRSPLTVSTPLCW